MRFLKYIYCFSFFIVSSVFAQGEEISQFLADEGFENVRVLTLENDLLITYENNLFRFQAKGLASVIQSLLKYDLTHYDLVKILLRNKDIPMTVVSFKANTLLRFAIGDMPKNEFLDSLHITFDVDELDDLFLSIKGDNISFYKIDLPVSLDMDYLLGDFNDGFMSRFYLNPSIFSTLGKGLEFEFEYTNIIQNDIPGSAISYPSILKLTQNSRLNDNKFLAVDFGFLPHNRFGFQARFRNYLASERFFVEFFYSNTRRGYLDQFWVIQNNRDSNSSWQVDFNYRYNKFDTDFRFTYGTFLSGDLGYKFIITRQFNEVYMNLFYARTDLLSTGSFGSREEGIFGFSLTVPFGQSKYLKPKQFRVRTGDKFDLLYRYSGFSFTAVDLDKGASVFSEIIEFYPEIIRKGLYKHLHL